MESFYGTKTITYGQRKHGGRGGHNASLGILVIHLTKKLIEILAHFRDPTGRIDTRRRKS